VRRLALNLTQGMLSRFGLRLVRWPRQLTSDADALGEARFFPVGSVHPWVVPPDLRENPSPWARVLTALYEDHASWPSSIVPEGGMLLHALVRNIQPRVIVETGTCLGASTIWMASALRALGGEGRQLHSFDLYCEPPDARLAASPLFNNRRAGVEARLRDAGIADLVHLHEGDSAASLARERDRLRSLGGVQLAFIDGDHSPKGALADLHAVEPVLDIGGYVMLHDVFPDVCNHVGPRWLVDNLATTSSARYQFCDIYTAQTNYGITLLRRIG
jgi:predicted O-methyltransferase YrrM